jgi:hypothetical protein
MSDERTSAHLLQAAEAASLVQDCEVPFGCIDSLIGRASLRYLHADRCFLRSTSAWTCNRRGFMINGQVDLWQPENTVTRPCRQLNDNRKTTNFLTVVLGVGCNRRRI